MVIYNFIHRLCGEAGFSSKIHRITKQIKKVIYKVFVTDCFAMMHTIN